MLSKSTQDTNQPTALIVEDEPELRSELREELASLWPELRIVGEAQGGLEAIQMIGELQPAVVFLDIQIPDPNGLEVAREIGDRCHVVFITAYDAHAIEAFEKGAVDYILKPLNSERLSVTVQRLQKRMLQTPMNMSAIAVQAQGPARSRYLRWVTASTGNTFRLVMINEVVYFQSDGRYTRVVLANSEVLITKTLKDLLEELDPEQFWQVHRSTIVNATEIASIEPNMAGKLSVRLKNRREYLIVSDSFMRRFRQMS